MVIKVLAGFIAGGRADTKVRLEVVNVPVDSLKSFLSWIEGSDYYPNSSSYIPNIYKSIKAGKIWVGDDSFGEGVVGFGPLKSKLQLSNKLRQEFLGDEEY